MRPRRRWLLRIFLTSTALWLFLALVPVVPYKPSCGGIRNRIHLDGPLRPEYQNQLEHVMQDEDISYWKWGEQIFVLYNTVLDGSEIWRGYDFYNNIEPGLVRNLFLGKLITGEKVDPPQALVDAVRKSEAEHGPFNPEPIGADYARFENCEVLRAGAIQVETMK